MAKYKFKEEDLIVQDTGKELIVRTYQFDFAIGIKDEYSQSYCRIQEVGIKERGILQIRKVIEQVYRLATETEKVLYG